LIRYTAVTELSVRAFCGSNILERGLLFMGTVFIYGICLTPFVAAVVIINIIITPSTTTITTIFARHEGFSESHFRLAVKKTSTKGKIIIYKNTCILKLFLSVVTAGIEALVVLGSQFL
jgi:hypothetical protein